jgi:hypothetical protein
MSGRKTGSEAEFDEVIASAELRINDIVVMNSADFGRALIIPTVI